MADSPDDAALVAAFLGGDGGALGAIYDRYAARLLDLATGMLRDPHEAADVVQDVFVAAARSLARLREPTKLRSWLMAITRHEVLRRVRSRARLAPTDFTDPAATAALGAAAMTAPTDPAADAAHLQAVELAAEIRAAAAGLDTRDQLVLELVARQGLSGSELADALGVTEAQCHVIVHRMRERVQRSLGALVVARVGRPDCPALGQLLAGWDGLFTVPVRKRVARHVEGCLTCTRTSSRYAVLSLLALAPAPLLPQELRAQTISAALGVGTPPGQLPGRVSGSVREYRFTADGGFPQVENASRRRVLVAAGLALLVMLGAGRWWVSRPLAVAPPVAAGTSTSSPTGASTWSPSVPGSASPTTGTTDPTGAFPPIPSTPPSPPSSGPGQLVVTPSSVDLGAASAPGTITVRNSGGRVVDWSIAPISGGSVAPFVLSATSGTLPVGATATVRVGVDRTGLPEGPVQRSITLRSSALGGATVELTARVERAPVLRVLSAPTALSCPWSVPPLVGIGVTDESNVAQVELTWQGPGAPGSQALTPTGAGRWSGRLGIAQVSGTWTWQATATDARGNPASISGATVVAGAC